MDSRAIVVAAVILGGAFVVGSLYGSSRFELVSVPGGAYRIDRLSGAVSFCNPAVCVQLPTGTRVPMPVAPGKPAPPAAAPETNAPPRGTQGT